MMRNRSVLTGGGRRGREQALLNVFGAFQGAAGLLLLAVPGGMLRDTLVPAACWLLLCCMLLALARMVLFSRGFADLVMCLCMALLFGLYSWCYSSPDLMFAVSYRPALCFVLLFTGISRILAFAQIMNRVHLPMLVLTGLAESVLAILLIVEVPDDSAFYLYLFSGLACILSGILAFSEAYRVHGFPVPVSQRYS